MSEATSGLPLAVMPRLDRGIQYAAAAVGRAGSKRGCSGILDRPVKPGDDNRSKIKKRARGPPFRNLFRLGARAERGSTRA
jgi:hypothetical protein